ncbi:MAG: PQQ-binding-like beta-propeller repeat protein [Phycisphaerales bacterium]|nr:MAG: PQQ-binding-like beta-propeller repeat protein [Phycisphaerales bacterium]
MARGHTPLYVGTNRHVLALDPRTGAELWRAKLPKGGSGNPVTMVIKGQNLYVGHHGHVFCLDKRNGSILWDNDLPKTGYHAVLLAMEGAEGTGGAGAAVAEQRRRQQAGAAAATTTAAT